MICKSEYILTIVFLACSVVGFSQITTDTIDIDKDAQVIDGSNYGSSTNMAVYSNTFASPGIWRTFIEADFSSIPQNAIIISAKLRLYAESYDNSPTHPFYAERVTASWVESTINWSNQPSVETSDQISIPHSDVSSGTYNYLDLTDHVQFMVNYPNDNYGWRIRLQSESSVTGNTYSSSDHGTASHHPEIEVKYVMPIEIVGFVAHCTNGNSDGAITVSVSQGTGTYDYYEWLKFDAGDTESIESGTNISNADVSGLDPGLYLLHVEDDSGYTNYRYFLVGEEDELTTVEMYANDNDTAAMYWKDAMVYDRDDFRDVNYGSYAFYNPTYSPFTPLEIKTLHEFQMDFDYLLNFDTARLNLYLPNTYWHYRGTEYDNEVYAKVITSEWQEDVVTWNIVPDIDTLVVHDSIPKTAAGYGYTDADLNLITAVEYWQDNPTENYGIAYVLADPLASTGQWMRQIYGSSDHTTPEERPVFKLSFNVKESITTTFTDSTMTGTISINAPNAELPFTYLISHDTIPDMDTLWFAVKDSISVLDSAEFYQGHTNSQSYIFSDVPPEHYHIAVFDNNGDRIMYEEVDISPTFNIFESENLYSSEDTLKVAPSRSWANATLNAQINSEDDGGIEFEVYELGGVIIGLNSVDDDYALSDRDFELGFRFDSLGVMEVIIGSTVMYTDTTDSLNQNDKIRIVKQNNTFSFYVNNQLKHAETLMYDEVTDFKTEVLLTDTKGSLSFPLAISDKWTIAKPIKYSIDNPECDLENGSITITNIGWAYWNQTGISVDIYDAEADTSMLSSPIISLPSTKNLPTGEYYIQYSWTSGSTTYNMVEYFTIGYPVYWNLQDTYLTASGNHPKVLGTNTLNQFGTATSFNTLEANEDGWVKFKVDMSKEYVPTSVQWSYWAPNAVFSMLDVNNDPIIDVHVFSLLNTLNKVAWVTKGDSTNVEGTALWITGNWNKYFKVELDAGNFDVTYEQSGSSTALGSVSEGTATNHIAKVKLRNAYIYDAYASFCYGLTTSELCAELDYQLDGNFYVSNNGKFCFVYNQEYNDSTITFNLYNIANDIVATQSDFNIPNIDHGENRIVLDLFAVDCSCSGHFVLEVINSKGEKMYLRYYSDLNGNCFLPMDCITSPDDGPK